MAHPDAQSFFARLQTYHGADHVSFLGPQVQDAAAVVGRDGVMGGSHLKEKTALLKQDGARMIGEELLQQAGQVGRGEFSHGVARLGKGWTKPGIFPSADKAAPARDWVM